MTPVHDAHCHFFSRKFFEALGEKVPERLGWTPPGAPEELADHWAAELDRHGNGGGRAALIASIPGDEDSVAAAVRRHPTRFVGFFMLDPTRDDAAERVHRALAESGLRVVCLFPAMQRFSVQDPRALKVFEAAAAHPGAAVFVHCGVLSVGVRKKLGLPSRFDMRYGNPLDLHAVALEFPKLPIIIPHFGAGMFREALMAADLCPNIYLDTSSSNSWIRYHPGLDLRGVFRSALEVAGPDRLLFGTDSSFFPRGWQKGIYEQQAAALREIGATDEVREKIFSRNFERLFPADS